MMCKGCIGKAAAPKTRAVFLGIRGFYVGPACLECYHHNWMWIVSKFDDPANPT
jgi:hypothetical protein